MKIHLILPAWGMTSRVQLYSGAPPIGLAYIAAALLQEGHDVKVTDAVLEGWENVMPYGPLVARGLHNEDVVSRISERPDIIGISVISSVNWPLVVDLCERLKQRFPESLIVLGGEHPTAAPRFSLATSRADVVVLGEGEETIVEVARVVASRDLDKLTQVPGIAFRKGHEYHETPPRERIRPLSRIPRPAWHLFDLDSYHRKGFLGGAMATGRRSLPILASRGCPYSCRFCTAPRMWGRKWIPREPQDVVDEMEECITRYGVTDFLFYDLTFVMRRDWTLAFCEEILRRNLDVVWQVGSRLEAIDANLARLLYRAGLRWVLLAPESGSEATRKRIGKPMRQDQIERAIRACAQAGIAVKVQVLCGFPDETFADALVNLRFAARVARLGADMIGTAIFAPYPGTEYFDSMLDSGDLEVGEDLLRFIVTNNDFYRPIRTNRKMPPEVVKAYQILLLVTFFGSRLLFHPRKTLRAVASSLTSRAESQSIERYLKAAFRAIRHPAGVPPTGKPMPWPPISYETLDPRHQVSSDGKERQKSTGTSTSAF